MKTYHAFVEDFKDFMRFFKTFYPELYKKYSHCIALPARGAAVARINGDLNIPAVATLILHHIITEFYTVRWN